MNGGLDFACPLQNTSYTVPAKELGSGSIKECKMPILSCSAGFSKIIVTGGEELDGQLSINGTVKKQTKMENKTEILCLSLMKNRGRGGKQQQNDLVLD